MRLSNTEIVQDRSRDNRYARMASVEPHAFVLQKFAHAGDRLQAERASAGEHHAMNMRGEMQRAQNAELLGPGSESPDISSRHGATLAQDCGAARERLIIGGVTHADSRNVSKAFHCVNFLRNRDGVLAFDTRQLPIARLF